MNSFDFFISHASEDKEEIARPLVNALTKKGFTVWFDEFSLKIGDSLSRSIDEGITHSKFGIVILSPNFFDKQWPQRELNSLASIEMVAGKKKILPIRHNVNVDSVSKFSPHLADKFAVSTSEGLDRVVKKIIGVFSIDSSIGSKDIVTVNKVLKTIIDHLVYNQNNYELRYIEGDRTIVVELIPFTEKDMARILGKEGEITKAIRQIMAAVGYFKIGKRVVIEIIEVPDIVKNLND